MSLNQSQLLLYVGGAGLAGLDGGQRLRAMSASRFVVCPDIEAAAAELADDIEDYGYGYNQYAH